VRVDIGAFEEDAILDRDGPDLASADAEEGEALAGLGRGRDGKAVTLARYAPQGQARRMQVTLPRMRTDDIAEEGAVVAPVQAIAAAVLLVGPAGGQVGDAVDVVIDDRLVAEPRPEDAIALRRERADEAVEPSGRQHHCRRLAHRASRSARATVCPTSM